METATALSLGQAARLTGLGKTTLARAIRAGRLSATRTETGGYSIEPCELARVFPIPSPVVTTGDTWPVTGQTVQSATALTERATDELVAALREMAAILKNENADLRQERDRFREERDQALRRDLPPPIPVATPEPKPQTWWRRLWRWLRSTT
jgi:excisionase family DNA binding protein